MISGVILMTIWLPLQVASYMHQAHRVSPFFLVGAFVDCTQILGLPKFRLRDSNGKPYLPDKALMQEPMAIVHESAGFAFASEINKRKAYILSYVRR